ncbi:2-polyprenyl-6-methoxyphenol hydroxylase-like FAD-dependent oxidoreductase [Nocardia transvalensis]|uniref:2-polyprenyl-6-methoxyphenol hydroxylase-like FAD-dependent oxidoreductase n=1 Tax=Nocardia transvalensis TaxID=37333 RepID=A0A7W9PLQ3_9NOCA|nr:FAD-dependent monooxygenase [Nocardia transvalensis]MBB5918485.1 2-polyprenyl-6-methoxyphenol hydroxylase-like FAD-dependent oxidoreductase [Nocardia transvalensis]
MVTIVGGGIAGTVLAGALARHGHPATLYERQANPRNGQFLVLDGRAHQALSDLGVETERLHAASHPLTALRIAYTANERTRPSEGHRLYFRDDLMRVLADFARATSAELYDGVSITDVDPATGALRAGDTAIAADGLVIASDGTDSVARARLEPDRKAEYAGQTVVYGTTNHPLRLDSEPSVLHFQGQLGTGVLPSGTFGHFWNDDVAVWFTRITQPELPPEATGTHPAADWAEAVRSAAPAITDLVDAMVADTDTVRVINARNVPLPGAQPPRPPIILCGDADHAITPAAGVGARDAIEDAAALAAALTTGADPAAAMAERRKQITEERDRIARLYEQRRR